MIYSRLAKEECEILKLCFSNIVYLLSNDIYTLEEMSKYCGNQMKGNNLQPLISVEELKTMKPFEAIILMLRMMPIKTKLLPYYQIDYGYDFKNSVIPKRKVSEFKLFELK